MNIIRRIDDGVEFFTVESTGESGISLSGLARLCGTDESSLRKLVKSVRASSAPDFLKPLQGEELEFGREYTRSYKNVRVVKSEYCVYFLEWYAFESQRPNDVAKYTYRKFAKEGIEKWIQGITGWSKQAGNKKLPIWDEARSDGKDIFRNLADAVKRYIDRHPEMSENKKKFLYSNTVDRLNLNTFGKRSKALKDERGISKSGLLRDSFSVKELFNVSRIEDLSARLIDDQDMYPPEAVIEAMDRMLLKRLK